MRSRPSDPKVLSFLSALSNLSKPKPPSSFPSSSLRSPSSLLPSLMKSLSNSSRPDLSLLLFLTSPLPSPPLLNSFLRSLRLLNQPSLIPSSIASLFPLFNHSPSQTSFAILLNSVGVSSNSLDMAYEAFFRIENPDSVAAGSLIAVLCRAGRVEEARGVLDVMLERGVKPTVQTCTCILKAYCVEGRIKEAKGFVELMENSSGDDWSENGELPKPDVVIYTVLIEGLCLVRDFDSVEQVLRESEGDESKWKPNSVTYNVYISALCRAGIYTEAFHQILVMREKNLKPTLETLNILFDCLCSDPNTVFEAFELLEMSKDLNWQPDSFFYNTLMGRFLELNEPIRVLKLNTDMLKKGVKPDTCSFTVLTRALCRVGKFRLAKFIITRTEIKADIIAYNTLLHELYKARESREMNSVYLHMIDQNILPSKFTCGLMIDCLCREGRFLRAMNFVIHLCEDKYLFSTDLISRLNRWLVIYGKLGLVLQLFDEMSKRGFELKPVLFDSLIKELCKKGFCEGDDVCKISLVLDYLLKLR
ncbi:hypothetical protein LUZ60_015886 [Juncus effusus]|nr:hypothetical protein LUZ60_015886 [Juncus effusus]